MIQIRKNVFETNSSSTHSICISKDKAVWSKRIDFHIGEYGWENDSVFDTASYFYMAIRECPNSEENLNKLIKILDNNNVIWNFDSGDRYYQGYIDHGSELQDFVKELLNDEDKLCRFLCGDSVIYTGNDNDDSDGPKMCDVCDEFYHTWDENWNMTEHVHPYHDENRYEYYYKGN